MTTRELLRALEAAPVLVNSDGDGGYTVHPITDEAVMAAAQQTADDNDWNDDEAAGLYGAIIRTLELCLGEGGVV